MSLTGVPAQPWLSVGEAAPRLQRDWLADQLGRTWPAPVERPFSLLAVIAIPLLDVDRKRLFCGA